MTRYEEGLQVIEERCGNGKDNVISLATIALEPNEQGSPGPMSAKWMRYMRTGRSTFTTWATSTKMQQIARNPEVAFAVSGQWFSGNGIGENFGWVLDPKNAS